MYKNTFKPMEYGFELSSLDNLEINRLSTYSMNIYYI